VGIYIGFSMMKKSPNTYGPIWMRTPDQILEKKEILILIVLNQAKGHWEIYKECAKRYIDESVADKSRPALCISEIFKFTGIGESELKNNYLPSLSQRGMIKEVDRKDWPLCLKKNVKKLFEITDCGEAEIGFTTSDCYSVCALIKNESRDIEFGIGAFNSLSENERAELSQKYLSPWTILEGHAKVRGPKPKKNKPGKPGQVKTGDGKPLGRIP
jgi:hypothetical protein